MGEMAARVLVRKRQDRLSHFLSAISCAFSELSLIIILWIDALLSYFAVRLARYCELRTPCLLCSRLDRFPESSNGGFYKELFCDAHKSDISSLALCTSHRRLADAREMCDDCLVSFLDTMEIDINVNLLQKEYGSLPLRNCTCCSRPFRKRPLASVFLKQKPISADAVVEPNSSSSRLSRVGFGEIKITSDSESRVPCSDDACILARDLSRVDVSPDAEITTEQVPLQATLHPLSSVHAEEPEVGHGEATEAFGSTDISLKASELMNENLSPDVMCHLSSLASTESITGRESPRVPEDLKVGFSQDRPEFPWNDISPSHRPNGQDDEHRLSDALNSTGILNHSNRYESGLDSVDGNIVSEVEGECSMDQLKRQIEVYKNSMSILYKELEEERNASEIAANEAMAMINRLQEEKASNQMEALQYLRLIEEQTEYDQEAIQKLNDLLDDREKEIQDLEAEVGSYRKQFEGGSPTGRVLETLGNCEEREYREYTPASTPRFKESGGYETGLALVKNSTLDFDDEKLYMSECLKSLEEASIIF